MLGKAFQNIFKTEEKGFQQIEQDGNCVFIKLLMKRFETVKSRLNTRQKLQTVSSADVSSSSAPSLVSAEETDCLSAEDTGRRYSQRAVATISYYGSTNSKFDSIMVSAEQLCAEAAHECTRLKCFVLFGRIISFVQICKDYEEELSCSAHNRWACPVCDHDLSSELYFSQ